MKRVRLIHWNAAEAEERAAALRDCGYEVISDQLVGGQSNLRQFKHDPPDAVVIDLTRLPSQGRDVGLALRQPKKLRTLPLVFVEGDVEKVSRIRQLLPDAVYTTWKKIGGALERAIASPPAGTARPPAVLAGYSGTPLPKKLGIKADSVVFLFDAPADFEKTLGDIPPGAVLRRQARGRCDLVLWFVDSSKELERRIDRMAALAETAGLWIIWPKKASGVLSDLSEPHVRKVAMAAGLVDYKVCAVDATWSGLKFARKKE
jgi:hypothetical protein